MGNLTKKEINETNEFMDKTYGKVLDELVQTFPDFEEDESYEIKLSGLAQRFPGIKDAKLSRKDEIDIKRQVLRPAIRTYVVGMVCAMIDESYQDLSEEALDKLWGHLKSEDVAKRCGITKDEGEIIFEAARRVILNSFEQPVVLCANQKKYTFSKTEDGLYVEPL